MKFAIFICVCLGLLCLCGSSRDEEIRRKQLNGGGMFLALALLFAVFYFASKW